MKVILVIFTKNICLQQMGHFGHENGTSSQLWIGSKNFLKILHNERGSQVHGNYINGFSTKKSCLGQRDYLGTKMVHPHNTGSTVRIVLQFCTMTGAKRDMERY